MKYYKVKPEHDNKRRFVFVGHSNLKIRVNGILVANELYTPRERERLAMKDDFFDVVEVSRKRVFWFFGARFSEDTGLAVPF